MLDDGVIESRQVMFTRKEIMKCIHNERSEIEKTKREIEFDKYYVTTCESALKFWEQMLTEGRFIE